ncbi:MAG: thioredoxin domain-containing protein [Acidobacteriota bacterium]
MRAKTIFSLPASYACAPITVFEPRNLLKFAVLNISTMKILFITTCILIAAAATFAQQADAILATAAGKNFTSASLSKEGQKLYADQRSAIAKHREERLAKMVRSAVLELEAKAVATTPEKLIAAAGTKAVPATPAELQSIYNRNSTAFDGRTLAQVRDDLADLVKRSREQKAADDYVELLKVKHKVANVNDVNAARLKPADILVTIGPSRITVEQFDTANKASINDFERNIFEDLKADLRTSMLSVLTAEEASSRSVAVGTIYASEVTDKLRAYTEQEKFDLETALQKRLFAKYSAKILLKEPVPFSQAISVDDDPASGPTAAPVTIVMFSDFQCPACSATHPVLKSVIAEYPEKIRFVVRDYPLIALHENAFRAALAANAANAQGKFFEYAEILYTHQDALDDASLKKYAASVGLNPKQFELDLTDEKTAAEVRKDMADAAIYGVSWTPTIYVNGVKVMRSGADDLREAIDRALSK